MVGPVALLGFRDGGDMELSALAGEVDRVQLADTGVLGLVGEMDALVDGKAVDFAELVVDVGTQGADAVGAAGNSLRFATV